MDLTDDGKTYTANVFPFAIINLIEVKKGEGKPILSVNFNIEIKEDGNGDEIISWCA